MLVDQICGDIGCDVVTFLDEQKLTIVSVRSDIVVTTLSKLTDSLTITSRSRAFTLHLHLDLLAY